MFARATHNKKCPKKPMDMYAKNDENCNSKTHPSLSCLKSALFVPKEFHKIMQVNYHLLIIKSKMI